MPILLCCKKLDRLETNLFDSTHNSSEDAAFHQHWGTAITSISQNRQPLRNQNYDCVNSPCWACALQNYVGRNEHECGFTRGDLLMVTSKGGAFWVARNFRTQCEGLIPADFVTIDRKVSPILEAWYNIDRTEAIRKLLMPGVEVNTYLLRPSSESCALYTISIRCEGFKVKHFHVFYENESRSFYLSKAHRFSSLEGLFDFYQKNTIDGYVGLGEARPRRVLPPLELDSCYIPFDQIKLEEELGHGKFGVVYKCRISSMVVAAKRSADAQTDAAFLEEAKLTHLLNHQRIVRFIGLCRDAPGGRLLIITEFMANGSLLEYLKKPKGRQLLYFQLIRIIDQIVQGMVYLEEIKVIHRDLRAANILVDSDYSVKIADFGLTRLYEINSTDSDLAFPIRWAAPEVFNRSKPTTKADVWSFGVLMFEILTYGETPYRERKSMEVPGFISQGNRLSSPTAYGFECDESIFNIMQSCWNFEPENRPTFKEISLKIGNIIQQRDGTYCRISDTVQED